jgi:hypothetical protein
MTMSNIFDDARWMSRRTIVMFVGAAACLAISLAALRVSAEEQPARLGSAPQGGI